MMWAGREFLYNCYAKLKKLSYSSLLPKVRNGGATFSGLSLPNNVGY